MGKARIESHDELLAMLQETGEHLTEDYLDVFFEMFDDLGIGYGHPPVPLEIFIGIAQAFADASGYRVVLQAAVVEPFEGKQGTFHTVGQQDVVTAEPAFFGQTVRRYSAE